MAPPLRGSPSIGVEASSAVPDGGDRLDSWKEIAAFLQRDVRTVQRWEKTAGLPVHRHTSSRLRTAFAYRSELDAWWRAQPLTLDGTTAPSHESRGGVPSRSPRRAVTAGVVAALMAALWLAIGARRPAPATDVNRDSPVAVLLTPLDITAGDAELARVLNEAVAWQIRGQDEVELVAPGRVAALLTLMRRDPRLPLTAAVGREVAIRDGRIDLLVTGEVHRLESGHVIHLQLVDPIDGRIRASVERRASVVPELPSAVRRAARQLAPAAHEPARRSATPEEQLEPVTTASLPALRLYSAAVGAGERRQWAAAEMLARRAVAADGTFASAHAWIGWSMRQQGRPAGECLPFLERALALSSGASDVEVHSISGAYHEVAGDLPRALAAYEALVRLEPRHRWGLDRLIDAYSRAGQVQDAVELTVRRAELAPGEFYANVRAAHALTVWHPDPSRAAGFVRAARRLATPDAVAKYPVWGAWLSVLPVFDQWMNGDIERASEALATVERSLDTRIGRERDAFATAVGFSHLAFGRAQHAERVFRRAGTPVRQINLALLSLHVGDEARARESLLQIREYSREGPALFARVGLADEAEAGLAASFGSAHAAAAERVTRGFMLARRGRTRRAIRLLREGAELLRFSGEPEYFLAIESLARLHQARGRHERATEVLAEASRQRPRTFGCPRWAGAHWVKLSVQLLAEYRRGAQRAEAERLRADLDRLLRSADATYPFARLIRDAAAPPGHGQRPAMALADHEP